MEYITSKNFFDCLNAMKRHPNFEANSLKLSKYSLTYVKGGWLNDKQEHRVTHMIVIHVGNKHFMVSSDSYTPKITNKSIMNIIKEIKVVL